MLAALFVAFLSGSVAAAPQDSNLLDRDEFLSQFKLREAAALSAFTFEGSIHRPARTTAAGKTRELVTFVATGDRAVGVRALQWELLDWDATSYEETVDAMRQYLLPPWTKGDPIEVARVTTRWVISDAVSVRVRDDHGIIETLTPDTAPDRKAGTTVEFWEYDADAPGILHELEKAVWASGHGIAPLLLTVESVSRDAAGEYSVQGAGKLDLREKRFGEWSLKLERIGESFLVRHAEFRRAGSPALAWSLETNGLVESAGLAIAANGQVRFWNDGACTTLYDFSFSAARGELELSLIKNIEQQHEARHAASLLSEHDCRGGRIERTTYRDGKLVSVPNPKRPSEHP